MEKIDPAKTCRIDRNAASSLAFDIGGTKILAVLLDADGKVIARKQIATSPQGGQTIITQLDLLADDLFAETSKDRAKLRSVAVGVPGVPNPKTGQITMASNIKDWEHFDIRAAITNHFPDCTIAIENDVNLAALGEMAHAGDLQGSSFGYINIGTGISLGIIMDGTLLKGARGAAGEIAFMPIIAPEPDSPSPYNGQLEPYLGSSGLVAHYNKIASDAGTSITAVSSVKDIFERASRGEAHAVAVIDHVARYLAMAILCIDACLDLGTYSLGGSIGMQQSLLTRIKTHLESQGADQIRIYISHLGNQAGLVGVSTLASQNLNQHFI